MAIFGVEKDVIYSKGCRMIQKAARNLLCSWAVGEPGLKATKILQFKKEIQPLAKATVKILDERLAELEAYNEKLGELLLLGLSQVKIQEALLLYKCGIVSLGRAAELAGIS